MVVNRVAAIYDTREPASIGRAGRNRATRVQRIVVGADVFPGPMPLEAFARLAKDTEPQRQRLG